MRRNFLAAILALAACSGLSQAQTQSGARAGAEHSTSVSRDGERLDIASGTRLTAELQNTLDVSKARVGDRVLLKTTEAIKSNGETIAKRGSRLVGHVAEVTKRGKGSAVSSVTIIFDRLESGSLSTPISATINSITQVAGRASVGDDGASADASARNSTSARTPSGSSSSGGGLLGGVTGAVGSTVGGVAGAASDVVGSTTDTVGGAARGVGQTVGQIQITQSASVSAEGGSTLSLTGGNLRLEKGTNFKLTLSESANVNNQNQ